MRIDQLIKSTNYEREVDYCKLTNNELDLLINIFERTGTQELKDVDRSLLSNSEQKQLQSILEKV